MNSRIITVYSAKGATDKSFETAAQTWGEIKPTLEELGFDLDRLQATENQNRTTLAHKDAKLPEGEFVIFLRPTKTKSGTSRLQVERIKDAKRILKRSIREEHDEKIQDAVDHLELWIENNDAVDESPSDNKAIELRREYEDFASGFDD